MKIAKFRAKEYQDIGYVITSASTHMESFFVLEYASKIIKKEKEGK